MTAMHASQEALKLDELRCNATLNRDVETLDRLLHDKMQYTHSNGTTNSKQEYLASIKGGHTDYKQFVRSNIEADEFGDVVLIRCRADIDVIYKNAPRSISVQTLAVWKRDDAGTWRMVAFHSAPIANASPRSSATNG